MKPLKQSVSLTLDGDVLEKLKNLAESCDRSLSQYINIILKQHVQTDDAKTKDEVKNETL